MATLTKRNKNIGIQHRKHFIKPYTTGCYEGVFIPRKLMGVEPS